MCSKLQSTMQLMLLSISLALHVVGKALPMRGNHSGLSVACQQPETAQHRAVPMILEQSRQHARSISASAQARVEPGREGRRFSHGCCASAPSCIILLLNSCSKTLESRSCWHRPSPRVGGVWVNFNTKPYKMSVCVLFLIK